MRVPFLGREQQSYMEGLRVGDPVELQSVQEQLCDKFCEVLQGPRLPKGVAIVGLADNVAAEARVTLLGSPFESVVLFGATAMNELYALPFPNPTHLGMAITHKPAAREISRELQKLGVEVSSLAYWSLYLWKTKEDPSRLVGAHWIPKRSPGDVVKERAAVTHMLGRIPEIRIVSLESEQLRQIA